VNLTDAEALEAQLVENLIRADVHPMEEANGFRALLNLEEPKYSIEQISVRTGKTPAFVAARLKLTELTPVVVEAFYREEIGTGHALLLARLQPAQQEEALTACYQEQYGSGNKTKRILLPLRHLQQWIEHNILLELATAPFSKADAQLVPEAGSCIDCSKRTGHNILLFADMGTAHPNSCSDPKCYAAKVDAHIRQSIAAKPKLVQISSAYGAQQDGGVVVPRNKYVEIHTEKPTNPKQREWPEYKTCKFTTEAIVTEGSEKGELRRVCANPECPVHHARKQPTTADAVIKAEQEQRRRDEAIAQTTGLRVLSAIVDAVPVRLMKRDLLFVVEHLAAMLDERRLAIVLRQHGIGKAKATAADAPAKLLAAFIRKADESTLGHLLVEIVILASRLRQGAQRSRRTVQGGRERHHRQGQAGVRRKGQGKGYKEGRAAATSKGSQGDQGGITSTSHRRSLSPRLCHFFALLPVFPPSFAPPPRREAISDPPDGHERPFAWCASDSNSASEQLNCFDGSSV
jgi:ParB family chromosome partitioning protein